MTAQEIQSAMEPLLREVFDRPIGSRPRRYQPDPEVLDRLVDLSRRAPVQGHSGPGEWRVVEGRRWLLNRRLDGRSVPLVQRDHVAIVVRSWAEAREVTRVLNWFDAPAPPRGSVLRPAPVAAGRPR